MTKQYKALKLANSELEAIEISNKFCDALITLQGGQILKFFSKKQNKDLLWLSDLAEYETGKAIRGGIPLCFPWFGGHPTNTNLPAHGFARNSLWQLTSINEDATGHHILLELNDSETTRLYWNYAFKLEMLIHCGEDLKLEFKLQNLDPQTFEFGFAWHSYFPTKTQNSQVLGLQNSSYIDQLDGNQIKTQTGEVIIFTAELDRIYPKTSGQFSIQQNEQDHIYIKSTAKSAVVWNPWIEKTKRLTDVRDDAWQDFICVEMGQVATEQVHLAAGQHVCYAVQISAVP